MLPLREHDEECVMGTVDSELREIAVMIRLMFVSWFGIAAD